LTGSAGFAGSSWLAGGSLSSGLSGETAAFAAWLGVEGWSSVAGLTSRTVVRRLWNVLHVVDFHVDVLSGALAEVDFVLHLPPYVVDIIVDHGKGDNNGQDGNNAEGYGGIGDEFVSFDPPV